MRLPAVGCELWEFSFELRVFDGFCVGFFDKMTCDHKFNRRWDAGNFPTEVGKDLIGEPWSPAGMVLFFRLSAEYSGPASKDLTPFKERGGCRHCTEADDSADCLV